MQDAVLLGLLQSRSEEALGEIDRAYGRLGRQIALRILDSAEDAEECWNDALLRLWISSETKLPEDLSAYLCKIVRNEALCALRKRNARKRGGDALILALDELKTALPAGNDPQDMVDALALREAINHFLWQLPPRDCEAFIQRYFFLKPINVIAGSFGIHRVTLSLTLRRIRKKLADYLTKEGFL